jgi:tRNA dimethylallyltransferase
MLAHGLEKEAANLAKRYGWEAEPMKGIGYREWQAYFLGVQTLAETRAKIISASQGLAKRQRTWFNHNSGIHWLANGDEVAEAVDLITTFLDT